MTPWSSATSFLADAPEDLSTAQLLKTIKKKSRRCRDVNAIRLIDILDAFRSLRKPRMLVHFFLYVSRHMETIDDTCAWVLFASGLLTSCNDPQRYRPTNAHLAMWAAKQVHKRRIAQRVPGVYMMCVQVCMRQDCPYRVMAIVRLMHRDGVADAPILQDALRWFLGIKHYELSMAVVHLLRGKGGILPRLRTCDVWGTGAIQHAPRLVRRIAAHLCTTPQKTTNAGQPNGRADTQCGGSVARSG